ncbi:hypothetical protein B5M44_21185 [Shinella sumterensis]|nr:hypothetical protein B5M44_21185 [Shinella sumterensis]
MVVLRPTGVRKTSIPPRTVLQQILRDANYESEILVGGIGPQHEEARNVIRLIKAATIGADKYPLSLNSIERNRRAGVDNWENEGGSVEE